MMASAKRIKWAGETKDDEGNQARQRRQPFHSVHSSRMFVFAIEAMLISKKI
jgi:hypothetical protein